MAKLGNKATGTKHNKSIPTSEYLNYQTVTMPSNKPDSSTGSSEQRNNSGGSEDTSGK